MFHNDYQKNDKGSGMAKALGKAIVELTKILEKSKPDLILSDLILLQILQLP